MYYHSGANNDLVFKYVIPAHAGIQVMHYYIYILASNQNGTLYVGVTSDLKRRVFQHKNKVYKGFTEKYTINKLVYYESTTDIYTALQREKQIKKWNRNWKLKTIEEFNPYWKDLYFTL